jgi:acyl-CoA thioester hydrolase
MLPTIAQIQQLPMYSRVTIPADFLDAMGHTNIRHYLGMFDEAAWGLFIQFGMTAEYIANQHGGAFALEQHLRYLAEVKLGETVAIYFRVVGHSPKRVHFVGFMVNETTERLACLFESLGSHVDMTVRRTSPWPPALSAKIQALLDRHNALDWDAPLTGSIQV